MIEIDIYLRYLPHSFRVLLQIVLLLVTNHLYPPPARQNYMPDEDGAREVDDDFGVRKRKKKRSRTDSFSAAEKALRKPERQDRRKSKSARRQSDNQRGMDEGADVAYNPEDMLDMLADRVALWHAVGAGSERATGSSGDHRFHADGLDYHLESDSDDELGSVRNHPADGYIKPDKKAMEEWDWVQRFCVNIVER